MKYLGLIPVALLLMGASATGVDGNKIQGKDKATFQFTPTDESGYLMNECPVARVIVTSNVLDNTDHDGVFNVYECPVGTTAKTATITSISQATSAVVDSEGHPFAVNHIVEFSGVVGMTEINGLQGTVTAVTPGSPDTFTVNINSSGFTAYTSDGTADLKVYSSFGCKLREIQDENGLWTGNLTGDPNTGLDGIWGLTGSVLAFDTTIASGQTGQAELRCTP